MTFDAFLHRFAASLGHGPFVAFGVAVLAGIMASGVCPCTLPVGLGMAGVIGASESQSRWTGFRVAVAFFVGIVVNLMLLGALAGRLGALLTESFGRYWTLAMALLSLVTAIGVFWAPRLKVHQLAALRKPGLVGALSYGFLFSLGTSPAPLLVLLTVATAQARPDSGLGMAFAFGVGRGLRFLLVGMFAGAVVRLTHIGVWGRALQGLSGCVLLCVSGYYVRAFTALL